MLQRLGRRAPLLRIQIEASIQQVHEQTYFLCFCLCHSPRVAHESGPEVAGWLGDVDDAEDVLLRGVLRSVSCFLRSCEIE